MRFSVVWWCEFGTFSYYFVVSYDSELLLCMLGVELGILVFSFQFFVRFCRLILGLNVSIQSFGFFFITLMLIFFVATIVVVLIRIGFGFWFTLDGKLSSYSSDETIKGVDLDILMFCHWHAFYYSVNCYLTFLFEVNFSLRVGKNC